MHILLWTHLSALLNYATWLYTNTYLRQWNRRYWSILLSRRSWHKFNVAYTSCHFRAAFTYQILQRSPKHPTVYWSQHVSYYTVINLLNIHLRADEGMVLVNVTCWMKPDCKLQSHQYDGQDQNYSSRFDKPHFSNTCNTSLLFDKFVMRTPICAYS